MPLSPDVGVIQTVTANARPISPQRRALPGKRIDAKDRKSTFIMRFQLLPRPYRHRIVIRA